MTFVRSTTLDSWTPEQRLMMTYGGNSKCKTYFQEQVRDPSDNAVEKGKESEKGR